MKTYRCEGETNRRNRGSSGYLRCKTRVKDNKKGWGHFCKKHERDNHYVEYQKALSEMTNRFKKLGFSWKTAEDKAYAELAKGE